LKLFGFLNKRNICHHPDADPFPTIKESYTRSVFESKLLWSAQPAFDANFRLLN